MAVPNAIDPYRMLETAYYALGAGVAALQKQHPLGRNIYDAEWDICIILDSTRVDMMAAVAPSAWRSDVAWSRGSVTTEWLSNTFTQEYAPEIRDTVFVTANPHSKTVFTDRNWLTNEHAAKLPFPSNPAVTPKDFAAYHEVWQTHATEHDSVPPDVMRHATVEAHQNGHSRVVSHWLQPHEPFIAPDATITGGSIYNKNVWDGLNTDRLDPAEVWQSYMANLDYAITEVKKLLATVDATVLITSDHGNAFGEWGFYGHPFGWPQTEVRKVPWYFADATPTIEPPETHILEAEGGENDTEAQLRALGYR